MRHAITWVLMLLVLGCPVRSAAPEVRLLRDIPYKEGAQLTANEQELCKLDLFLPSKAGFPLLVWFHGGGLTSGSKDDIAYFGAHLAAQGIGVALVNYRLSPQVKHPEYLRDGAAAVAWALKNGAKQGGKPGAVFVGGHSSGAYLAMSLALDTQHLKAAGVDPQSVQGWIPIAGTMSTPHAVREERGDRGQGMRVDEAAPLNHVHGQVGPLLNLCGEKDHWILLEENRLLTGYLQAMGNREIQWVIVPGRDHFNIVTQVGQPGDPIMEKLRSFLLGI